MPLHSSPDEPPRQLHAVNKLELKAGRAYVDTTMPTLWMLLRTRFGLQ